ncbi:bacteriocin immunity protein [Streptomyces sp. NPDC002845]
MALGDLSRDQLVELVRRIVTFDGTEEEVDAMEQLFEESVPYPGAYSLIYRHDPELTPEEVVDTALSYEPIAPPYNPDA